MENDSNLARQLRKLWKLELRVVTTGDRGLGTVLKKFEKSGNQKSEIA